MAQAMTTDEFHVEQELRDLYYSPETGYRSEAALYRSARDLGLNVTHRQVKDWLEGQATYTKFKPSKRPTKYRHVFVKNLGDQLQMDLVDMQKFKAQNDDTYWILTAIEVMSRYAFAVPVLRKDTSNMTDAVESVIRQFSKRFGRTPNTIQFDEGNEFYNVGVRELLKGISVDYFSTKTGRKASIVERFNRTLKTRMWKYFDAEIERTGEKTNRWLGVLGQFVDGYNSSVNSTIKMRPMDVNRSNADVVFTTLYGYGNTSTAKPKFKAGDRVRVHKYKNVFAKGFEANFSDEVFTVSEVHAGDPNMYRVKSDEGKNIVGRFYESEMSTYTG